MRDDGSLLRAVRWVRNPDWHSRGELAAKVVVSTVIWTVAMIAFVSLWFREFDWTRAAIMGAVGVGLGVFVFVRPRRTRIESGDR